MLSKNHEDFTKILCGERVHDADPEIVKDAEALRDAWLAWQKRENLPPLRLPKPVKKTTLVTNWWRMPSYAFASVLAISLCLFIFWSSENQIDSTFQTIYAQKNDEMLTIVRDFQFRWEKTPANARAFGASGEPSVAEKAFGAGLLAARETLLGNIPPERFENEWASYFELGRWTFLLWTACQFPNNENPKNFWDKQREILAQLKAEFDVETDDAKEVIRQLENLKIEQLLNQLPNEPEIYDRLSSKLERLMSYLAPPPKK